MSTEPLERRSVLDMGREIIRLRRIEKRDRAVKDRLRGQLIEEQKINADLRHELWLLRRPR